MPHNVIAEAKKCLNCKKPLCRTGCPINTPIPQMIQAFLNGDIDGAGYLDRLYVHAEHVGKGIGTALCDCLEGTVRGTIVTHASVTAKPFFEKRGYVVVKKQQVERRGVRLVNFIMKKER